MLLALSHLILNLTLCSAIAKLPAGTPIPVHVQMWYRVGGSELDKVIPLQRQTVGTGVVEFDMPRSTYRMVVYVPKFDCGVSDFIDILADNPRTIAETLTAGQPQAPPPSLLLEGTAPMSFLYAKPTIVLFDRRLACDQAVGTALASHVITEYDNEGFYTWIYLDQQTDTVTPSTLALRLRTPTGLYHYVKLPYDFPKPFEGWPDDIHFDLTSDQVDDVATKKPDTLLCEKFFIATVH
jgi:hypothetical protein